MGVIAAEITFGVLFSVVWVVISVICFSRIQTLLNDRQHPLASPLMSAKILIMVLLGLWAFFYGALREFELFFSETMWHAVPVCLYYVVVVQILRPAAVILFCFVISTPALPQNAAMFPLMAHNNCKAKHVRSSDGRTDVIHIGPGTKYLSSCLDQTNSQKIDDYNNDGNGRNGENYECMEEMLNYRRLGKQENGVSGTILGDVEHNSKDFMINPIIIDPMCSTSSVSFFSIRKPIQFSDLGYMQRENVGGKSNGKHFILKHNQQNGFKGQDECGMFDVDMPRESCSSDLLPGAFACIYDSNELKRDVCSFSGDIDGDGVNAEVKKSGCKDNLISCIRVMFYWVIGRIPPNETRVKECYDIIDIWSRLLVWRLSLRMRFCAFLYFLALITSITLTIYALTGEPEGCFERGSEKSVCYTSGVDTNSKSRVHIPRSIICVAVLDNAVLLFVWVTCGVSCLRNIGNVLTKESFTRTYTAGAFLFTLQIVYGSVQLYDQFRYNEIVKVLIFIFENICDCSLVLLLALRLGSGSRQMPRWYTFLVSISTDVFKKICRR